VKVALAGAIAVRGGKPEIGTGAEPVGPVDGERQQRIDPAPLEVGRVEGRGPPDVGTGLEHHRRRVGRVAGAERGEVARRRLERPRIEGVEARPERRPPADRRGRGRSLDDQGDGEEEPQVRRGRKHAAM
jgi:hypothetical protein